MVVGMKLRYRYRLYPHPHQQVALAKAFGCARVVWNDALAKSRELYAAGEKTSYPVLAKLCITQAKQTPERAWLSDTSNVVLQQSARDLDQAFRNWWASLKGKRKGPKVRAPRFKKRRGAQSIRFMSHVFRTGERTLTLSKIGSVPIEWSRALPSASSSVTVLRDAAGRFFASFVVEIEPEPLPANGKAVGIDLGLASLAITSDGEKVPLPKHFDAARKRLRHLQRQAARKRRCAPRGTRASNRLKAVDRKIARLHAKVADQRTNGLHQLTSRLVRDHDFIAIEDLKVSAMLRAPKPVLDEAMDRWLPNGRASKRALSRAISDAGWASFRTMLEQKAERAGKRVVVVNPAYTSRRCNHCGHTEAANRPSQDTFRCQSCGHTEHADINAARNILEAGLALSGRGALRNSEPRSVAGCEASTRPNWEVQPCAA
jgi:putative transposase